MKQEVSIKGNYTLTHLTDDLIKKLWIEKYGRCDDLDEAKKGVVSICR